MPNERDGWNEHAKLVLAELIRLDKNDSLFKEEVEKLNEKFDNKILLGDRELDIRINELNLLMIKRDNEVNLKVEKMISETKGKAAIIAAVISFLLSMAGLFIDIIK